MDSTQSMSSSSTGAPQPGSSSSTSPSAAFKQAVSVVKEFQYWKNEFGFRSAVFLEKPFKCEISRAEWKKLCGIYLLDMQPYE
jgi:hypothetical protein